MEPITVTFTSTVDSHGMLNLNFVLANNGSAVQHVDLFAVDVSVCDGYFGNTVPSGYAYYQNPNPGDEGEPDIYKCSWKALSSTSPTTLPLSGFTVILPGPQSQTNLAWFADLTLAGQTQRYNGWATLSN